MHPIHEIDVSLLLALAIASKRRPAELIEIIAALQIVRDVIPAEARLIDAITRLSSQGLIRSQDGGVTLTEAALRIMDNPTRTTNSAKRIARIKEQLAAHEVTAQYEAIHFSVKEICVAVLAYRALAKRDRKAASPSEVVADNDKSQARKPQSKPHSVRRRKD